MKKSVNAVHGWLTFPFYTVQEPSQGMAQPTVGGSSYFNELKIVSYNHAQILTSQVIPNCLETNHTLREETKKNVSILPHFCFLKWLSKCTKNGSDTTMLEVSFLTLTWAHWNSQHILTAQITNFIYDMASFSSLDSENLVLRHLVRLLVSQTWKLNPAG